MLSADLLRQELESLRAQEQEHFNDLMAVRGAIQLCVHLIAKAEAESDPTLSLVKSPAAAEGADHVR